MTHTDARALVEQLATESGFSALRFGAVSPPPDLTRYDAWIDAGYHADLSWLERGRDVRADPRIRLPEAQSVVVLGMLHHHRAPPDPGGRTGQVARYAWGRDYHNLVGKRLRKLRARLREAGVLTWGGVDTAPIVERAWAQRVGLGASGKNCVQFLPGTSSWIFLAVLFLDAPVEPDLPLPDHCGSCTRCLVACPTDAFVGAHVLDARRCISYWTIEAKGLPPRELRSHFGRWVFGCDRCQEVCPHNHHPPDSDEDDFLPRNAWLDLDELVTSPDEVLMERFNGTPLRRPKASGLKRNALIALGNLQDPDAVASARVALAHPEPVVRAAAVWCLDRLGDRGVLDHRDEDALVADEVRAARGSS